MTFDNYEYNELLSRLYKVIKYIKSTTLYYNIRYNKRV